MTERMKEIKEMAKTYSFDELEEMLDDSMLPGNRQDKSLEILFAMVFRKLEDMELKINLTGLKS